MKSISLLITMAAAVNQPVQQCNGENEFQLKKGTLKANIQRLVQQYYQGAQLIYEVGHHEVFTDTCIKAELTNGLVQQLIEPYFSPQPIYFMTFRNNVAAVFYQNDGRYSQYLRVAR
jgi:adenosine deaminase